MRRQGRFRRAIVAGSLVASVLVAGSLRERGVFIAPAGAETFTPDCNADLGGMTTAPDGSVQFVQTNDLLVTHITPTGTLTQTPYTNRDQFTRAYDFTRSVVGSDGALWTGHASAAIVRVDAAGHATSYRLPSNQPNEYRFLPDVTAGPDGNVWFTFDWQSGNKVGFITPAGAITLFDVPDGAAPMGIATGSDGQMWITATKDTTQGSTSISHLRVFAVTTAGSFTEFGDDSTVFNPDVDAVLGPDGAVWFGGFDDAKHVYLGRVTTSGAITKVPLVNPGVTSAYVSAMTLGPDGRLWAAVSDGFTHIAIEAVTTAGAVSQYASGFDPSVREARVETMTAGGDGRIWFGGLSQYASMATDGSDLRVSVAPVTPAVTCLVSPEYGAKWGNWNVTVSGRGFTNVTRVRFGSVAAPHFTVVDDHTITVTTPRTTAGWKPVTVDTSAGPGVSYASFFAEDVPTVTSVCPGVGPTTGGNQVQVSGSYFLHLKWVHVGQKNAAFAQDFDQDGNPLESVTVTIPAVSASKTVDITVHNSAGTSAVNKHDKYRYIAGVPTGPCS